MTSSNEEQVQYLSRIAVWSIAANAVLGIAVIVLGVLASTKKVEAYATTDSGRVIPMTPVSAEFLTESRVNRYAADCIRAAFEHDFEHYRKTMGQASECFTGEGVNSYLEQITPLVEQIRRKRMVMSVSVDPPVVAQKGLRNGAFEWVVQTNIQINLVGINERVPPANYTATVGMRRITLDENVRGVSLTYINLKPRSGQ